MSQAVSVFQPPIIYFNIGWMTDYTGFKGNDRTKGGHAYLKNNPHGGEAFNFKRNAGRVRGYRPPGGREKTDISRMGAARSDEQIEGALVVWFAGEPTSHRALIVGWYRNARVFRTPREGDASLPDGERICYSAEAAAEDAVLLRPSMRTFQVPRSSKTGGPGFGQKPTWYGDNAINQRVYDYISGFGTRKSILRRPTRNPPENHDPDLRVKVEKAAIDHAKNYYTNLYGPTCKVNSVETLAKGWDLEVIYGPEPLLVEVKGLMNSSPLVCELTPNEFEQMMLCGNRKRYIIYIVINALAEPPNAPIASIFEYAGGKDWVTADGRKLIIQPKTGAVLSCQ